MEAAYALPRWLKPETASSRVWLLDGLLHIVPLPTAAAPDIPSFPSLKQAKQIVHSSQIDTVAGACLPDIDCIMQCYAAAGILMLHSLHGLCTKSLRTQSFSASQRFRRKWKRQ